MHRADTLDEKKWFIKKNLDIKMGQFESAILILLGKTFQVI